MKKGVGRLEIWPLSGLPESVVRVDTSELAGGSILSLILIPSFCLAGCPTVIC